MKAIQQQTLPARLAVLVTLAQVLQRLENSTEPVGADQYRSVVQRLSGELLGAAPDARLDVVLNAFPAAAELYENLRYEQAGLCRSPLERSLNTEMLAREIIDRVSKEANQ